jgi:transcriptional regulator with XRE-family HTH domain
MKFDELFDQRNLVAKKLKDYIRERGFTKVSFAKKVNISRPTLDKLLNGSIENKSTFDRHLQKVLAALNLSVDDLVFFETKPKVVDAVYSQNAPGDYQMSAKAQKQYGLLMDILDLCEIYY